MLNSKIEKILLLFLWGGILLILIVSLPANGNSTFTDRYSYVAGSALISLLCFYLYIKIRNNVFMKKIYKLVDRSQYQQALAVVDNAIKGHPKTVWIQIEKVIIEGCSGEIYSFYTGYNKLVGFSKYENNPSLLRLVVIKNILDFLLEQPQIKLNQKYTQNRKWNKFIVHYYNDAYLSIKYYTDKNYEIAIYHASRLLDSKLSLFNCLGNYVLFKISEVTSENTGITNEYYIKLESNEVFSRIQKQKKDH